MPDATASFQIGVHRPVYLWGGPGTVRMNRLKFMDAPVDEAVHAEAHTLVGATRMAQEAAFTWAYLMYDWGFPPEVEQEDWEDFRRAVQVYHAAGMRVFGYVQASNCVEAGSFRDKDWYALGPRGRHIYYYTGRSMTCWRHPQWQQHLRDIVRGIVEHGADGVFFDNPWHGAQPVHLGGAWLGPAGCYCERCRAAFQEATGLEIPTEVAPATDSVSRRYLRWRADEVTAHIAALARHARALNPNVVISANDFDAVMRNSYLIYGIDLAELAEVQDVLMIEDYGLPRVAEGVLVNNALTLRTARALAGDTPVSVDPYDAGIGFDAVYPARRFRQAIAEAAACGASMVVKGTEYVEAATGTFTLLTAAQYAPQRQAIGALHRWLAAHSELYAGRRNAATVALLHPGDALWQRWDALSGAYFGAGQTLLAAGIPWRVVTAGGDHTGVEVLLHVGPLPADEAAGVPRTLDVTRLSGWTPAPPAFLARNRAHHRAARGATWAVVDWLYRAYFKWRWARQLGDRLDLVRYFVGSPHFRLPPSEARDALLTALGAPPVPRVTASTPVLAELWAQDGRQQVHLVNYDAAPQEVTIDVGEPVRGELLSPDGDGGALPCEGPRITLPLDVYSVLVYTPC
jgi:hypothetical protein